MYPVLVDWGFLYIPSWHFFYVLGALFAYQLLIKLALQHEPTIPPVFFTKLFVTTYIWGYVGARLLSILIEEQQVFDNAATWTQKFLAFMERMFSFGPMTFYGGAILAILFGWLLTLRTGYPVNRIFDLAIPAGFFGLVFGRIGCFLNGDDYGKEIQLSAGEPHPFWAIRFPNLGDDIYRWPVQIIESFLVLSLVVFVVIAFKKFRQSFGAGSIAFFTMMGYANIRLFTEFLRDDFRGTILFSWLSTSQFISIIILFFGSIIGFNFAYRNPTRRSRNL